MELLLLQSVPAGTARPNPRLQHKRRKPVVLSPSRLAKDATHTVYNAHSPVNVCVKEAPGVHSTRFHTFDNPVGRFAANTHAP
jgi:hypothetical protein